MTSPTKPPPPNTHTVSVNGASRLQNAKRKSTGLPSNGMSRPDLDLHVRQRHHAEGDVGQRDGEQDLDAASVDVDLDAAAVAERHRFGQLGDEVERAVEADVAEVAVEVFLDVRSRRGT